MHIKGSQLAANINGGPVVCEQASQGLQCYQPSPINALNVVLGSRSLTPRISISGSPLVLVVNGVAGNMTVNNTSSELAAVNVTAILTGTALNGIVTVDNSNCTNIPPLGNCTLSFMPSTSFAAPTSFNIQGTNTNAASASLTILSVPVLLSASPSQGPVSRGTVVTITGLGLLGANHVYFGNQQATSFTVVNQSTVSAVSPQQTAGSVNIEVTFPSGDTATLVSGFNYTNTSLYIMTR